jgi:hypothetical protein
MNENKTNEKKGTCIIIITTLNIGHQGSKLVGRTIHVKRFVNAQPSSKLDNENLSLLAVIVGLARGTYYDPS